MQVEVYNALTNSQMSDTMRKRVILLGASVESFPEARRLRRQLMSHRRGKLRGSYTTSRNEWTGANKEFFSALNASRCAWLAGPISLGTVTSPALSTTSKARAITGGTAANYGAPASGKAPAFSPLRTVAPGGLHEWPGGGSTRSRRGSRTSSGLVTTAASTSTPATGIAWLLTRERRQALPSCRASQVRLAFGSAMWFSSADLSPFSP